jgi:hypothetical protein
MKTPTVDLEQASDDEDMLSIDDTSQLDREEF